MRVIFLVLSLLERRVVLAIAGVLLRGLGGIHTAVGSPVILR